jgi:hypothetical protein
MFVLPAGKPDLQRPDLLMAWIAGSSVVARTLETTRAVGGVVLLESLIVSAGRRWLRTDWRRFRLLGADSLGNALGSFVLLVFRHDFVFRCENAPRPPFLGL